ncbi:MAG TPA: (d)CMP kinase, partial [Ilumatobacteraceae bacterium]|nr:(d)CMP kinase [Ilumatobacteraceae bacterium]
DGDRIFVDGTDATEAIRGQAVSTAVSPVATNAGVRAELVRRQRAWAAEHDGGVIEGRDIGTAVFPDAPVKVFLTATPDERARRRAAELADDAEVRVMAPRTVVCPPQPGPGAKVQRRVTDGDHLDLDGPRCRCSVAADQLLDVLTDLHAGVNVVDRHTDVARPHPRQVMAMDDDLHRSSLHRRISAPAYFCTGVFLDRRVRPPRAIVTGRARRWLAWNS